MPIPVSAIPLSAFREDANYFALFRLQSMLRMEEANHETPEGSEEGQEVVMCLFIDGGILKSLC